MVVRLAEKLVLMTVDSSVVLRVGSWADLKAGQSVALWVE